jgi:hypothetical protein
LHVKNKSKKYSARAIEKIKRRLNSQISYLFIYYIKSTFGGLRGTRRW